MITQLPKSQIEIKISVPAEELEKFLDLAAEKLSKDLKIDGFRPGKAPRKIVEQKVGSEKVLAHAAEIAVKKSYVDSIVKNKIEAVGEPQITITKIAAGNDLEYKAVVGVMPRITLGNYRKQTKSVAKPKTEEIKPEKIQKELDYLQKSRAKLVTVSREAKKGDQVEIDFDVFVDGKTIDGGTSKNHPLTIGEGYFIPGFEDNLVGMKEKDEKEFELNFPKDYHKPDLAGKPARFKVKMNLVQEKELPKISDEFAKSLGRFESLENLKSNIEEGLKAEQKKKNDAKWQNEVIDKITGECQIEIPDVLLSAELDKMMNEFEGNIASMGMNLDQYLGNIKKTRDEIRKDWTEAAEKRVKASLILEKIAKDKKINVAPEKIEEEVNKTLEHYKKEKEAKENIDPGRLYNYVKGVLINEEVFKYLENL